MTALVWDKTGERVYHTGIDRGVLYLADGTAVPWNGLTSVEDTTADELSEFWLNGVKYLAYLTPGDFSANLKAFTYPDEFDSVMGILRYTPGLRVHDQSSKTFSLSYRTKIGDDIDGIDAGYLIHLIYNVLASSDSQESSTIGENPSPTEFSWVLTARPVREGINWRPTAHVSIDSRDLSDEILQDFEDLIYGTVSTNPSLPNLSDIPALLGYTP
jgi:hypothetical protein